MQSCQFAKSVIERGSGKLSTARPAAVSSVELQYTRSRPCSLCFRNHSEMLTMVCSRARLRARLSWSSQILLRHVLDLRTPLPRQGNVTDSFIPSVPYIHSALVVNGSGLTYYQLQLGWVVSFILFRFGGSAFCVTLVFVRSRRENLLLLSWQSLRHVHSLSRYYYFFHLRHRSAGGLIVWRTFLNLSKMMYRLACFGRRHFVS